MRVLHIASERTWRGGEQQIAYLIEELQQQDVENFVACSHGSAFESYCKQHHIPHLSLSFSKPSLLSTANKLKMYVNQHRIQLIHMHSSNSHTLGVLAHMLGAKADLILSRRVEFMIGKNPLSRFKYNYKGIKRVLCVADNVRKLMTENLKDGSKCVTVHSGIDLSKFGHYTKENATFLRRTYVIPEGYTLIGNVSAIDKFKDYYTYLDTAAILKEEGIKAKYFVIGSGALEQEIKAYTKQLGLEDDVIFTGFLNNVNEVLPELDVFLITTLKEGFVNSVLNSFACRTPVVATIAGGIPEMVEDGETGMLAPVKRPDLLAQKVKQVLEHSTLREKLVNNAFKKVQQFTKEQTALHTLAVYKEVLQLR